MFSCNDLAILLKLFLIKIIIIFILALLLGIDIGYVLVKSEIFN